MPPRAQDGGALEANQTVAFNCVFQRLFVLGNLFCNYFLVSMSLFSRNEKSELDLYSTKFSNCQKFYLEKSRLSGYRKMLKP